MRFMHIRCFFGVFAKLPNNCTKKAEPVNWLGPSGCDELFRYGTTV